MRWYLWMALGAAIAWGWMRRHHLEREAGRELMKAGAALGAPAPYSPGFSDATASAPQPVTGYDGGGVLVPSTSEPVYSETSLSVAGTMGDA
jgi:hypothetical protein